MNKLIKELLYVYGSDKLIERYMPYYRVELEERAYELRKAEIEHAEAVKERKNRYHYVNEALKSINERW